MKYLILTEGTDEKALFDIVLELGIFIYKKSDLLLESIIHCRQFKTKPILVDAIRQLPSSERVTIIRIGDKISDKFVVPLEIKQKVLEIIDYHTTPEFEILIILKENKYKEYIKSGLTPKEFARQRIVFNGRKYDCSTNWVTEYFQGIKSIEFIALFKQYDIKRKKAHPHWRSTSELIKKA